jgi:hypothetical protein
VNSLKIGDIERVGTIDCVRSAANEEKEKQQEDGKKKET